MCRKPLRAAGVRILEHSPALALLDHEGALAGARGFSRQHTERMASAGLCGRARQWRSCPAQRDGDIPILARPDACQTCFMRELYCPADALYVSPLVGRDETVDEAALSASTLGSFSRKMGWSRAKPAGSDRDPTCRCRALSGG